MDLFQDFSKANGLYAHPDKCKLYFGGVLLHVRQEIVDITRFTKGCLPFKYLGVPLSSSKLTANKCRLLVEKIVAKIKHWN